MTEKNYSHGDHVTIGGGIEIMLVTRKGRGGVRWTWVTQYEGGEVYWPTPGEAIAHAAKILNAPECRHGERGWCPACHDDRQ
jgi:hypothetical protein